MHAHSVQTAILSEIGDGWISAREIADKYQQWSAKFIAQQLRYFYRAGVVWRRIDVDTTFPVIWTARYTRPRGLAEIGDPSIGKRARSLQPAVLADPQETFHADPA